MFKLWFEWGISYQEYSGYLVNHTWCTIPISCYIWPWAHQVAPRKVWWTLFIRHWNYFWFVEAPGSYFNAMDDAELTYKFWRIRKTVMQVFHGNFLSINYAENRFVYLDLYHVRKENTNIFYDKRTLGFYERLAKSPLSSPFLENRLLNVDSSATSGENQEVERNTRLRLVFLPTLLSCVSRFLRAL